MILGAHIIIYSKDAEADRTFLRDVLNFPNVDAGHGWLIFALPGAEAAVHPGEENNHHELYLICDDVAAEIATLRQKGVAAKVRLPGGGEIGLYQPKHSTALLRSRLSLNA
jgi:catechol 2,3-dioxygenase-like lactoylglutathione lyase family enzyme